MMEGGSDTYGATVDKPYGGEPAGNESSQLMASAMAGAAMDAAKVEAVKFKNMVLRLRDGPPSIKIMSYVAGILLVMTGFFSFFGKFFTLHPVDAVVHLYMFVFGWVILVLEARSALLPAAVVENIHKYCGFTTVVWGRGAFFIFIGTLALAQWEFMDILLGSYLVLLGAGMIYWGQEAYKKMDGLVAEMKMKDPETIRTMFDKFDHNSNGFLDLTELGQLLRSLGADLRPTEIEAAFINMDADNDGKVNLEEFSGWWSRNDTASLV